jgi:hypothetical protein
MGSTMISILKIKKITEADFKKIEDSILEISRGKHEFKLRPVSKTHENCTKTPDNFLVTVGL